MAHQDPLHRRLALQRRQQWKQRRARIAKDVADTDGGQVLHIVVGDIHGASRSGTPRVRHTAEAFERLSQHSCRQGAAHQQDYGRRLRSAAQTAAPWCACSTVGKHAKQGVCLAGARAKLRHRRSVYLLRESHATTQSSTAAAVCQTVRRREREGVHPAATVSPADLLDGVYTMAPRRRAELRRNAANLALPGRYSLLGDRTRRSDAPARAAAVRHLPRLASPTPFPILAASQRPLRRRSTPSPPHQRRMIHPPLHRSVTVVGFPSA